MGVMPSETFAGGETIDIVALQYLWRNVARTAMASLALQARKRSDYEEEDDNEYTPSSTKKPTVERLRHPRGGASSRASTRESEEDQEEETEEEYGSQSVGPLSQISSQVLKRAKEVCPLLKPY